MGIFDLEVGTSGRDEAPPSSSSMVRPSEVQHEAVPASARPEGHPRRYGGTALRRFLSECPDVAEVRTCSVVGIGTDHIPCGIDGAAIVMHDEGRTAVIVCDDPDAARFDRAVALHAWAPLGVGAATVTSASLLCCSTHFATLLQVALAADIVHLEEEDVDAIEWTMALAHRLRKAPTIAHIECAIGGPASRNKVAAAISAGLLGMEPNSRLTPAARLTAGPALGISR